MCSRANTLLHFFGVLGIYIMKKLCWCGKVSDKVPCEKCKCKPRHQKKKWWYDHKWRVLSERFRADNPLCHDCNWEGRTTPAEEVHHIKPISEYPELRLKLDNIVALCKECHATRHRNLRAGEPQWQPPFEWKKILGQLSPYIKGRFYDFDPQTPAKMTCQNGSAKMAGAKMACQNGSLILRISFWDCLILRRLVLRHENLISRIKKVNPLHWGTVKMAVPFFVSFCWCSQNDNTVLAPYIYTSRKIKSQKTSCWSWPVTICRYS